MASPAAVLSILVNANATEATATLSKFDRQLAAVDGVAKKGVEARLGAKFDPVAFDRYQASVERAARVAKDRTAFKAELGANFNAGAFRAYERSIDQANRSTGKLEENNRKLGGSFRHLASSALAFGGAFAGFEAAKGAIESTVELAHSTERLSAVTGLDAKAASSWIEIMKVRGVSAKQTSMAFITLSKQISAAQDSGAKQSAGLSALVSKQNAQTAALVATGASQKALTALHDSQTLAMASLTTQTGKAAAAFKELGVRQGPLKAGNTLEVLRETADGLSRIEDPARRAALAQQMFGRGAQALLPILQQGRKGVDDALAAAQRYGAYLPSNVRQLEAAHNAQMNLNLAMDGLKISFTQAVLPSLVAGAGKLMAFIAQVRSGKGAGGEFARAVSGAFHTVKGAVEAVVHAVGGIKPALEIAAGAFVASKVVKALGVVRELGGAVRSLGSAPGKLAGLLTGRGGSGVAATVGTMEVGTMIVKNMIGGPGGGLPGGGGAATTAERDAATAAEGAGGAGLAAGIAKNARFLADTLPKLAGPVGAGIAITQGIQALSKVLGEKPQIDVSGILPGLGSSTPTMRIPNVAQKIADPLANVHGNFGRTSLQGAAAPGRALQGVALDAARAQAAMQSFSGSSSKAFANIAIMAARTNDLKFMFADRVASDMLKAKGVNRHVVADMTATLAKLPPAARVQAADTALQMAGTLEAKGAIPRGSAEALRKAITGSFIGMRVDTVAQAGLMANGVEGSFAGIVIAAQGVVSAISSMTQSVTADVSRMFQVAAAAKSFRGTASAITGSLTSDLAGVFAHKSTSTTGGSSVAGALDAALKAAGSGVSSALKASRAATHSAAASKAAKTAASTASTVPVDPFAAIPSQTLKQIQAALIGNKLQVAQNANNVKAQHAALAEQLKLDDFWLNADKQRVAQIKKALSVAGLTAAKRKTLLADELATLQAIGSVEGNVGSTRQALQALLGSQTPGVIPIKYTHDHPTTGTVGRRPGERAPEHAPGLHKGIAGLHIEKIVMQGVGHSPQQIAQDMYLKLRPYLQAPPY